MRIAIVHYWLTGMRGGEKVLEQLCAMYPDADIFTHVYDARAVSDRIASHKVTTSFIGKLPWASKLYRQYLPLMPLALEQLDLRGYDLILSSEAGPAKGIIPPPDAVSICYCHSPMRYIWNMAHDYRESAGFINKLLMPPLSHYIRSWDVTSSNRVDHFVANSKTVARRIEAYYRREATVIYPPVDTESFECAPRDEVGDFYLMVGQLVPYKRPDLAVEAFNRSGRRLVIIGGGEMLAKLKAMAEPNITFLGSQPFEQLRYHYARCKALIFPGEEDFGIVPVEAMASGRPVIAFNRGGATETVVDGVTGIFFEVQTVEALLDACDRLERTSWDSRALMARARLFDTAQFSAKLRTFIDGAIAAPRGDRSPFPRRAAGPDGVLATSDGAPDDTAAHTPTLYSVRRDGHDRIRPPRYQDRKRKSF
ncbi:glycosyl transferase [Kaistia sp. 32K]|uniref:glycosyltransferase n=1 Tax=Kaistia sp. 32K TaxID=2795690 RepID=UPI0019169896|nr:glycosyltransferase [Kaistia sp. 32K]BCP52431.1 glycosyl transferase [Kaistia sp. 32K]